MMKKSSLFLYCLMFVATFLIMSVTNGYAQNTYQEEDTTIHDFSNGIDDIQYSQTVDENGDTIYTQTVTTYESDDEYIADEYDENSESGISFNDSINTSDYVSKSISPNDWNKLHADKDYTFYKEKVEVEKQKNSSNSLNGLFKFIANIIGFFTGTGGLILLWLIIIAFALFVAYTILENKGITKFSNPKKILTSTDELSDDFIPENWGKVISEAEKSGNYRLATRHSFRHVLISMQEKGILSLNSAQSNHNYVIALKNTNYYDEFKQLLRHYEYVWYGMFAIDANHYNEVKSIYQSLINKV